MNTEHGISADEACRAHVLTEQDFARMCNEDGSLKSQPKTTTITLKDSPSKTFTVDSTILYASMAVLALVLVGVVLLLVRHHKNTKKT